MAAERKIQKIEFSSNIYPKCAEVGKTYPFKNEIIETIKESELMVHIYTNSCGVNYGTPISIYKKDVRNLSYTIGD